jgi:oligoendopeptidase F
MLRVRVNCLSELRRTSPRFPRRFVPDNLVFSSWENLEPLFRGLLDRKLESKEALEQWLLDDSELGAAIGEELTRRRIALACDTSGKEAEKAFLHFVENISPKLAPYGHLINLKFLECPYIDELDHERYAVAVRQRRCAVRLFSQDNIPLQVEIDRLTQQYQKVTGAMMVDFKSKERTMSEMLMYFQDKDRDVRREAWKTASERRLREAGRLDELFDRLLKLRVQLAKNTGFPDFRSYMFCAKNRFDYTPEDCVRFHDSIEKHILPVTRRMVEERQRALGVDSVRPWDMYCDRYGRDHLRPFETVDQLASGCRKMLGKVDKEIGDSFQIMIDLGLLDLESRKGKAPFSYQLQLPEVRLPYIFMSAVGLNPDVFALLHEAGHAFHQFAVREEPLLAYRSVPNEFAEVAAMTMELLSAEHLEVFYAPVDAARARRRHFEDTVAVFPEVGIIDAFQHWVYAHPDCSPEERSDHWFSLLEKFSNGVDWSGLDQISRNYWHSIPHIFLRPFYFIEYAIAQLGALKIWHNSRRDKTAAVEAYKSALQLGGSAPLPALFKMAEIEFGFSEKTIKPVMVEVSEEVERQGRLEIA